MRKRVPKKKMTLDGLAVMVAGGFEEMQTYVDKRFDAVDKRFEAVDKRFEAMDKRFDSIEHAIYQIIETLKIIQEEIKNIHRDNFARDEMIRDLRMRVDRLEKKLEAKH